MELKIESQARGVRIIAGDEAKNRRILLNQLIALAEAAGFEEIVLPSIEPASVYVDKATSLYTSPTDRRPPVKNSFTFNNLQQHL